MTTKKYPGSQSSLYQTGRLIVGNCRSHIASFSSFSEVYTDEYLDSILESITTAELLPMEEARALEHETLREELIPLWRTCLNKWQFLKRYIDKMFPENPTLAKFNFNAAGWQHYDNNFNWLECQTLMNMGSRYITEHRTELLANDNMPGTFEASFNESADAFNNKYGEFAAALSAAPEGTDEKIEANNTAYGLVISVCLDGQVIFADDDTLKAEFSYEKQSELIVPTGPAGLKGTATMNGEPATGIIVQLENKNLTVVVDNEGAFDFGNNLASGKDKLIFKQGDEILKQEEVTIPPGVTVREDVTLGN